MASVARKHYTADEFFDEYEPAPGKHELIRGVPHNMAGGSRVHSLVARNVQRALDRQTQGGPCQSFTDAGVAAEDSVLYPDVAIFRDPRDFADLETERRFYCPSFVVEVLSPTTRRFDLNEKLELYKALPSVRAIMLIDPVSEVLFWHHRTETGWRADWLTAPEELDLAGFDFTLPRAEIFAR